MSRRQLEQPPNNIHLFLVARQYRVRVGSAETECAHADDERPIVVESDRRDDGRQVPAGGIDVGINRVDVDIRRNTAMA